MQLRPLLGRWISIAIVAAAGVLGLVVLYHANRHPRTEDAEVFANFIGIAPQVDGPLIRLNVKDNQFVKKANCCMKSMNVLINMLSKPRSLSRPHWRGKSQTNNEESPHW